MGSIAIVYTSPRRAHRTRSPRRLQKLAKSVSETTVELIRLVGSDIRRRPLEEWAVFATLAADAIIFGTPTYMGGYSAQMKAFIDASSAVWMTLGWKGKLAAGFTHSGGLSGDKLNTLASLWVNAMQHGMVWVGQGELVEGSAPDKVNRLGAYGGAMAQTDWGQDNVNDGDRKTAAILGKRVAEATARWVKGK